MDADDPDLEVERPGSSVAGFTGGLIDLSVRMGDQIIWIIAAMQSTQAVCQFSEMYRSSVTASAGRYSTANIITTHS